MIKFTKISLVSLASLGLALSVLAQNSSPTQTPGNNVRGHQMKETRQEMRQEKKDIRQNMRETKKEARENTRDTKKEARTEIKEMRQMNKEEIKQMRTDFKDKIKDKRDELKDRIATKREELKEHLKTIKDERKKQVVEKIDKSLDALNEKMTGHFINILDKLEDVLAKIGERTDKAEGKGVDVSSVRSAIDAAKTAIANTRTAIEVQAGKTYTLTINTEDKLRDDVKKIRQALHSDLKTLHEKIKAVRNSVHEAARAFAKAHGRNLITPTSSPTPIITPTP